MPLAVLFVEGKLDSEMLNPLLQGTPVLKEGGSKNVLKPRTRTEREDSRINVGYLRDRDFDFDPPPDDPQPVTEFCHTGIPCGWHWCRHEIENYLLEPAIVSAALGWAQEEINQALRAAAWKIRGYQAARWTIGRVRRFLPPHYQLNTRPGAVAELQLPPILEAEAASAWAFEAIARHRQLFVSVSEEKQVAALFDEYHGQFDADFMADVAKILTWFSGKDLIAGLAEWLQGRATMNPGQFRASLRDWIMANPDTTLELLPEWRGLLKVIRA